MKHFIVEITFIVGLDEVEKVVPAHRAFLAEQYQKQVLLFSGPQEPRVGGLAVGRAESLDAIKAIFAQDPYQTSGVASYRFIEFNPVLRQDFMLDWIEGK